MWVLEIKKFLRSRIALTGLLFILLAGICSIHVGQQFLKKQTNSIHQTIATQQERIHRNVQYHSDEMGLLLYYVKFAYINTPTALSALSIGQRDLNPSIQNITIRNLEGQKYDTDLYNPANLLAGNLDFSFVLIYLFPLIIVAFCYNILSEEKEGGTWRLIKVQARTPLKMLGQKIGVRAVAVYSVLVILFIYASLVLSLKPDAAFFSFISLAVLYIAFWFTLIFWVMSWHQNSSVNAVSLLTFWLLLTIVCPALVNNYLLTQYPVPEAFATLIEQREGLHEKWDMDKKITLNKFYAHYPQFTKYALPDKEFSWLWYYAMQQMGDDEAQEQATKMQQKLWLREKVSNTIAAFVPTLHTQLQLNHLAESGLSNHLLFLKNTARFHEKLRLYFYPKIFAETPVKNENWRKWQAEYFREKVPVNGLFTLLPILLWMLLLLVISSVNLVRNTLA